MTFDEAWDILMDNQELAALTVIPNHAVLLAKFVVMQYREGFRDD